jgi:O-acetyl-ADP-ribose deacetylase (regulator of RNase III)
MITIKKGNIFTTNSQVIVNTVNCVGVMGAGIAFEFKLRYPKMFNEYQKFCESGQIKIGNLWIYNDIDSAHKNACSRVLNFPTKVHWKDHSSLHYIEQGLEKLLQTYQEKGIVSIAFPLLGASLGGLSEEQVLKTMKNYLNQVDDSVDIEIWYFDTKATDDLFDELQQCFTQLNAEEIKQQSGLGISSINKISAALNQEDINSLGALLSVKGIGKTSVEKLFDFIKRKNTGPENLTLF